MWKNPIPTNGLRPILFAGFMVGRLYGGSIEGTVTNAVTGEAVSGVEVRFLDQHSYVFQTVTDSSGTYRLTNLQDGDYRGEFSKDGFQDARDFFGPPDHVSGDLSTRQDARMNPFGGLRGRVIDEEGNAARNVRVEIAGAEKATDENGEFAFPGLRPGSYTVVAKPEPATRVQDGVQLGAVPIYYPSATDAADAVPVRVEWGQEVSGIAIRLKRVPVRRITGVVLDAAGQPAAKATVKLLGRRSKRELNGIFTPGMAYSLMGGRAPEVARVETRGDGSFEFPVVQEGDWRLSAEGGAEEDKPVGGVAPGTVADKDLEDVRIRLSAPFAVPVDAGDSSRDAAFLVQLMPLDGQPIVNIDPATNVGKINGIFPGRYGVIDSPGFGGKYVASVLWGGRDVLGQVAEFGEGSDPLQVVVRKDGGSLRGVVENGEGSSVLLVRRESGEMLHYRQTKCGAGGVFQFDGVAPGNYYAVAFDRVPQGFPPGDLVDMIASLATSVRIEAGSVANLNLRVNQWRD